MLYSIIEAYCIFGSLPLLAIYIIMLSKTDHLHFLQPLLLFSFHYYALFSNSCPSVIPVTPSMSVAATAMEVILYFCFCGTGFVIPGNPIRSRFNDTINLWLFRALIELNWLYIASLRKSYGPRCPVRVESEPLHVNAD